MTTGPAENPWERLRAQAQEPDGRTAGEGPSMLTPDGAQRLYSTAAVVLASIRELVTVAEELVQQRLDAFPDPDGSRPEPAAHPDGSDNRFRAVRVRDVREDGEVD